MQRERQTLNTGHNSRLNEENPVEGFRSGGGIWLEVEWRVNSRGRKHDGTVTTMQEATEVKLICERFYFFSFFFFFFPSFFFFFFFPSLVIIFLQVFFLSFFSLGSAERFLYLISWIGGGVGVVASYWVANFDDEGWLDFEESKHGEVEQVQHYLRGIIF